MIGAHPKTFFVFEIFREGAPFQRFVFLKQTLFEYFVKLKTSRRNDVEQVDTAAMLLENLDNDLGAAETKQLGFDKRIFFLERMDHRRAVANVRRAVI